ncbi:element excision factor XisI family protein [Xanthocytophaga flava]|uniref:element excision factor XisI family protein n=1 Tax=Xanthocytophaga flava TaxID=3048013 RepID=UPI0028D046B7|nr:element excision factor XisI family protein [Xanthocytophaga flavus]MDJ1471013.1 element excision factor XisI family protein [Xanthocytophaga flavus]
MININAVKDFLTSLEQEPDEWQNLRVFTVFDDGKKHYLVVSDEEGEYEIAIAVSIKDDKVEILKNNTNLDLENLLNGPEFSVDIQKKAI